MKKHSIFLASILALTLCGCSEKYDDSALWKGIDESYNAITAMKSSVEALEAEVNLITEVVNGGVITSFEKCASGGYTVTYTDSKGVSQTAVIASKAEAAAGPVVGTKEDESGVLCWTVTSKGVTTFILDNDGSRIPVAGRTPHFAMDASGYWTVNGAYVFDANGNKVLSEGKTVSVIKEVEKGASTITLTLADDSKITLNYAGASLKVMDGGTEVTGEYVIPDLTTVKSLTLVIPEGVKVKMFNNKNLTATISGTNVSVTFPSGFESGSFTLMLLGQDGSNQIHPVFFITESGVNRFRGILEDNDLFKIKSKGTLAKGCSYYDTYFVGKTSTKSLPRQMNIVEVDLSAGGVRFESCYANDAVPNPNANGNANNGFNKRETLSMLCKRKISGGEGVVAGINAGFFDSNDGISRGAHIERGELLYIPNPDVINNTPNHNWAFTIFNDGTASCDKKVFKGYIQVAGTQYEYYAVNDTILRGGSVPKQGSYPVNVFNSRYMKTPNPQYAPSLHNTLAKTACYVIAEYTGDPMYVNAGWTSAKVIKILDGRTTALSSEPFITSRQQVGIQLFGKRADEVLSKIELGDIIKIRSNMTINGEQKPIDTMVSSMWKFVEEGQDASASVPVTHDFYIKQDPMTMICIDKSATRVFLVQIDGRDASSSIGVNASECAQIALKIGAYGATRFDGGGSSAMWVDYNGKKGLVSDPSDSRGERSCLNYVYVRTK